MGLLENIEALFSYFTFNRLSPIQTTKILKHVQDDKIVLAT